MSTIEVECDMCGAFMLMSKDDLTMALPPEILCDYCAGSKGGGDE